MKKTRALFRRFIKKNSEEKALLAYSRDVREAIKRKEEVLYWLCDIARCGPFIK